MSSAATEIFRVNFNGGRARLVYTDAARSTIARLGDATITRASHVEPATAFGWESDGWLADMRPSGGALLYDHVDEKGVKQPFETRQAALDAERVDLLARLRI